MVAATGIIGRLFRRHIVAERRIAETQIVAAIAQSHDHKRSKPRVVEPKAHAAQLTTFN